MEGDPVSEEEKRVNRLVGFAFMSGIACGGIAGGFVTALVMAITWAVAR